MLEQSQSYVRIGITLFLFLCNLNSFGQDPVFSQYYLNKNYLNPAYAGYSEDYSVGFNSRFQWSRVPGTFMTNTAHVNAGCPQNRLGFALMFVDQVEGEGYLHTVNGSGQISVNLDGRFGSGFGNKLYGKKYIISAGLHFGVSQKYLDWSKLTFSDQYTPYTEGVQGPTLVRPQNESSNPYVDIGAGVRTRMMISRKESFLSFGAAIFHINRPVETFFSIENKLQPRYTAHFFSHFQLNKYTNNPDYLSIGMIHDRQQGLVTNTFTVEKDIYSIAMFGMSFRRQNFLLIDRNVDALVFHTLFSYWSWTIGYSYDVTVSDLGLHNTFGTHEISLTYVFQGRNICSGKGRKNKKADSCFELDLKRVKQKDFTIWKP